MADCVIAMKSQTTAEKARRAAASERIHAEVVSIDPSVTKRGCSVGLRLNCGDAERLTTILERKNIAYGDMIGRIQR